KQIRPIICIVTMLFVIVGSLYYPYAKEQSRIKSNEVREQRVEEYAEVVADSINAEDGDIILINTSTTSSKFATKVAEKCYQRGADGVKLLYNDRALLNLQAKYHKDFSYEGYFYNYMLFKYEPSVMPEHKIIKIVSNNFSENQPTQTDLIKFQQTLAPLINEIKQKHNFDSTETTTTDLPMWTMVPYPEESWATKVYPELDKEAAFNKMLDDFLDFAHTGQDENFLEHCEKLTQLAKKATDLDIVELHYKSKTADLHVPLHENQVFTGGLATNKEGKKYFPNIPTEEIFTMPSKYGASGTVTTTRPFIFRNQLVEELRMTFEKGKMVDYSVKQGADAIETLIKESHEGIYLGEAAIVSAKSPIFQSKKIYYEILIDENSGAHIALGNALSDYSLKAGAKIDENVNVADYHIDVTIGSEDLTVTATLRDGSQVDILKNGQWNI
ncbi:MAG: aminopeptidase, partial [Christensenellaceae bacterium]